MDKATSAEVRELMEYDEDTVGSIMTTDFLAFQEETRPDEILTQLRKLKPEADAIYAIYVTDAGGHLIGEVSLRDLVVHDLDIPLSMFMNSHPVYVRDTDNLDALMRLIQKYSLLAVPVVSMDMKLLGTIVIDDIVYQVLRRKRRSL
jgi:Mg/Co/Ni transporter MgtE